MKRWLMTLGVLFGVLFPISVFASVQAIEPNAEVRGVLSAPTFSEAYTLTLPSAGQLEVDLEYGDDLLDVRIEKNGKELRLPGNLGMTRYVLNGALEEGTYRIIVENENTWEEKPLPYRLATRFTPANNDEMEPNQEVSSSALLPLNKWQTGFISSQDAIDVYQIDVKAAGSLDLQVESTMGEVLTVELINRSNKVVYTDTVYEETVQLPADLEPGTYYLRIGSDYGYSDGLGGAYQLRAGFKAAKNVEKESNNTPRTASAFPLFQQQIGFLSWNDSVDYYKFVLPKTSRVSFDLYAPTNEWSTFILTDSKGNTILDDSLSKAERYRKSVSLAKGTYYVKLEKSSYDRLGGAYRLQINSTHLYPALSVNKVTTKSTAVTGKTEKYASVTMTIGKKSYTRKADAKGNYSFKVSKQRAGTVIKITSNNKYGSTIKTTKVLTK